MSNTASFNGTNSRFNGGLLGLIGINLLCALLCMVTLFIGAPWAIVINYRWHISHTTYSGRALKFDGKGGELIGSYLLWIFLSIITLGIYALFIPIKIRQWKTKHTHFADEQSVSESKFTGHAFGLLGINILCVLLILITLTLGLPAAIAMKQRWETKNTIIDNNQLEFLGQGINLFGQYIKWLLLSIITIGIYSLWIPLKFENWIVSNTKLLNSKIEVSSADKQSKEKQKLYAPRKHAQNKNKFETNALVLCILNIITSSIIMVVAIYSIYAIFAFGVTYPTIAQVPFLTSYFHSMNMYTPFYMIIISSILFVLSCVGIKNPSFNTPFCRGLFIFAFAIISIITFSILPIPLLSIISTALFAVNYFDFHSKKGTNKSKKFSFILTTSLVFLSISFLLFVGSIILNIFYSNINISIVLFVNTILCSYISYYIGKGMPIYYHQTLDNEVAPLASIPSASAAVISTDTEIGKETNNQPLKAISTKPEKNEIENESKDEELKALEKAIKLGSITAYAQLGSYYENRKEYDKAFENYLKSYELGSPYGPYFVARMFEEGLGRQKDLVKAHEWDFKAAEMGESTSQFNVGYNYKQGIVVKKDLHKALHFYSLASESGDFDAAIFLGRCYLMGGELAKMDANMAEKHLFNAVKNALDDEQKGIAYNNLSILYLGCLGEDESSRLYLNRCLWFMNAAIKLGDKDAIENSKKVDSILIIDERAKKEVSSMKEPDSPILPADFYRDNVE
ncbi:MAG: DUF898 family protein [Bacilli bacterium]